MPPFLALLSAYYLCDAAAALHPIPPATAQACAAHYEAVKATFLEEGETGPAARTEAYRRFKAWEAANADLVDHLRDEAREAAAEFLDRALPGESA